jgi:hypothetical protein
MRQSPGGLVLGNLVISGLYEAGKVLHNPVTVALRNGSMTATSGTPGSSWRKAFIAAM